MSQNSTYTLVDQSGTSFRASLNTVLKDLISNNSGSTEPVLANVVPGMLWYDTSTFTLKVRNSSNSTWTSLVDITTGNVNSFTSSVDADTLQLIPPANTLGSAVESIVVRDASGLLPINISGVSSGNAATGMLSADDTLFSPATLVDSTKMSNRKHITCDVNTSPLFSLAKISTTGTGAGSVWYCQFSGIYRMKIYLIDGQATNPGAGDGMGLLIKRENKDGIYTTSVDSMLTIRNRNLVATTLTGDVNFTSRHQNRIYFEYDIEVNAGDKLSFEGLDTGGTTLFGYNSLIVTLITCSNFGWGHEIANTAAEALSYDFETYAHYVPLITY